MPSVLVIFFLNVKKISFKAKNVFASQITFCHWYSVLVKNSYRTRAIISRGLYIFLPHFKRPFMYCDLWPYVWLIFKSGF